MMKRLLWAVILVLCCLTARADVTINNLGTGSTLTGTEKIPMFQGANPATTTTPNAIGVFLGGSGGGGSGTVPTVFNCDPTVTPFYANLNVCLAAANTFATTNESGSGKAAQALLPQGTLSLSPAISALTLTAAGNASAGSTVYTGTITGGGANAFAGKTFYVTGFAKPSLVLTAAANTASGTTVYSGTITGGASNALAGAVFYVAGFVTAANNGVFLATASSTTTLTLVNQSGVSETHAGTAGYEANNGIFLATASSGTTLTLNNPLGSAATHAGSAMSPFVLNSGVQILGTMPRVEYISSGIPDASFPPNGGTYIDCGATTNVCFGGTGLRGIRLENLGFQNFGVVMTAGSDGVDGISFSEFRNLFVNGSASTGVSSTAFNLANFQHIRFENINIVNVNVCWMLTQQSSLGNYGNSGWFHDYCFTYPKSVANGNNTTYGMTIQTITPTSGTSGNFNYLNFYDFQINSNFGDNTGANVVIRGLSGHQNTAIRMYDADIEGNNLYGLQVNYTQYSTFGFSAHSANTFDIQLSLGASDNIVYCSANCKVAPLPNGGGGNYIDNSFYGNLDSVPTANNGGMKGAFLTFQDDKFHVRTDTLTDGFGTAFPIDLSQLTNASGNSTLTTSGQNLFTLASSTLYSQFILQGASNFTFFNTVGPSWNWQYGNFGSNDFVFRDGQNSTVPMTLQQAAPTNSLYVKANGAVGLGTASPAGSVGSITTTGAHISAGTKFTATGCSLSATTGGATAGTMTSGTTGTCTPVVTLAGATGITAPNGWSCYMNNQTHQGATNLMGETTSSATTVTFSGTTVSGDVLNFGCTAY